MHSFTERKESDSKRSHYLSCEPQAVIKIYDAWDYIDDCYYSYFTDKDMNELKDKCNGKFSCSYERPRKQTKCKSWGWYRWKSTKSTILYDCERCQTTTTTILSSSELTTIFTKSNTKFREPTSVKQQSTSIGRMNTAVPVTSTRSALQVQTSNSNDAVIAGSVIGVLGVLALVLILLCFILKRRKTAKHTRKESVTNAVVQNSNVLYVVSENGPSIPERTDDEPPAYHTLENIPDQNHIYINDDYKNQDLNHQHTNNYNHISTDVRQSHQNDDYNHTDTDNLTISGRPRDDYNHISVSGRSVNRHTEMDDGYNHIRSTEGIVSNSTDDYNHIGGQVDGEENKGYVEDDYNHLANINQQITPEGEQPREAHRSHNQSKSENDYANIAVKEGNNVADYFEPDDTYVYT